MFGYFRRHCEVITATSCRHHAVLPGLQFAIPSNSLIQLVGAGRFERPTPCAQGRCATRLRYAPTLHPPILALSGPVPPLAFSILDFLDESFPPVASVPHQRVPPRQGNLCSPKVLTFVLCT